MCLIYENRTGIYIGSTTQEKQLIDVPVMEVIGEEDDDLENMESQILEFGTIPTSRPIPTTASSFLFGMIAGSLRSGKSVVRSTKKSYRMSVRSSKLDQKNAISPPSLSSHPRRSFQAPDVASICSISPPHRAAHNDSQDVGHPLSYVIHLVIIKKDLSHTRI